MRICLIGATHPCHNPRLIREADTLVEAGHDVRVVAPCFMSELAEKDIRLLATRKWRLQRVDFRPVSWQSKYRSLTIRGRRKLALMVFNVIKNIRLAEYAYTVALPELTALASREPADWFIAHTQATLPVAAAAAKRWRSNLGFDCEDLLAEADADPSNIARWIEQKYLPKCDYISVPSQSIASQLAQTYHIRNPLVLYNVFPLKLTAGLRPPVERPRNEVLRLHWFGQTIGPGRGIEEAVEAMGLIGPGIELYLRGWVAEGFRSNIDVIARRGGVSEQIIFQSPLDHDNLIASAEQYDVGLALETGKSRNYSMTVTNKFFSYLLAGLAVATTDTQGQQEILLQVPGAGFLYPPGDPLKLALGLRKWIDNPNMLLAAKEAAWQAARQRFCWDLEFEKFLLALNSVSSPTSKNYTDRSFQPVISERG